VAAAADPAERPLDLPELALGERNRRSETRAAASRHGAGLRRGCHRRCEHSLDTVQPLVQLVATVLELPFDRSKLVSVGHVCPSSLESFRRFTPSFAA
jgi:hypothetical protein